MIYTHPKNEFKAIQDYLQKATQQQELLALRGQVDIEDNWQELRELEIIK
jgi:hypothetical protein